MTFEPRIVPFGERALFVEVADAFSEDAVAWSRALADDWERRGYGVAVPAYASVVLRYEPSDLDAAEAERHARELLASAPRAANAARRARLVEIPTRYDGPDLVDVAERSRMSVDELVGLHGAREYTAYFLGFMPGFAYCGRLDPRIVAPRLDRPRERVPVGAVAIADGQTAVYPFTSPGGWRLIGSTDVRLFDAAREDAVLVRPGDRIRFVRT